MLRGDLHCAEDRFLIVAAHLKISTRRQRFLERSQSVSLARGNLIAPEHNTAKGRILKPGTCLFYVN